MKRKLEDISNDQQNGENTLEQLYGPETKRRRLETQRIGDFIVDAKKSLNLRLSSDLSKLEDASSTSKFFSPYFCHSIFKDDRISGYEGLSVDITFSKKRLIPFVQIGYENKAPAFANIDNIQEKLEKHFGRIKTQVEDFTLILNEEKDFKPQGIKITEFQNKEQLYSVYKVSLEDESFHEQNFYLQSFLPFFIDGASVIEPSPFWHYFLVYENGSNNLISYTTVFEAHHSADKFRARLSQMLVLPLYHRRGFGSQLYDIIYKHYQKDQPNCFELIVEDASESFQKLLDQYHTKAYLQVNTTLAQTLKSQPISNVILNESVLKSLSLSKQQLLQFATQMKLYVPIIQRAHELIIYASLDVNDGVQKAFRLMTKKRYFLTLIKTHIALMHDNTEGIMAKKGGLQQPYIFNDSIEENPFCKGNNEEEKNDAEKQKMKVMTQEAFKVDLGNLYTELIKEYEELKESAKRIIGENQLN